MESLCDLGSMKEVVENAVALSEAPWKIGSCVDESFILRGLKVAIEFSFVSRGPKWRFERFEQERIEPLGKCYAARGMVLAGGGWLIDFSKTVASLGLLRTSKGRCHVRTRVLTEKTQSKTCSWRNLRIPRECPCLRFCQSPIPGSHSDRRLKTGWKFRTHPALAGRSRKVLGDSSRRL